MSAPAAVSKSSLWKGILLGLAAAAFFSVSFVLNRMMSQSAGHWAWSSALRFLMMLPGLMAIISLRGHWRKFWEMWRLSPGAWILWGSLGCGVFYTTLTAACSVSPAWVVAATWPVAIVIGILLGPIIYQGERKRVPRMALLYSLIILVGIALLQVGQFQLAGTPHVFLGLLLVLVSATAHPIGNRRSMMVLERAGLPTDAILRTTLMIVGSLPMILLLCVWGWLEAGPPPATQLGTVGIVAAVGLIATPMFYAASDRVSHDPAALAAVEATQSAELVFTLALEALILGILAPDAWGWLGLAVILTGILLHARPGREAASE